METPSEIISSWISENLSLKGISSSKILPTNLEFLPQPLLSGCTSSLEAEKLLEPNDTHLSFLFLFKTPNQVTFCAYSKDLVLPSSEEEKLKLLKGLGKPANQKIGAITSKSEKTLLLIYSNLFVPCNISQKDFLKIADQQLKVKEESFRALFKNQTCSNSSENQNFHLEENQRFKLIYEYLKQGFSKLGIKNIKEKAEKDSKIGMFALCDKNSQEPIQKFLAMFKLGNTSLTMKFLFSVKNRPAVFAEEKTNALLSFINEANYCLQGGYLSFDSKKSQVLFVMDCCLLGLSEKGISALPKTILESGLKDFSRAGAGLLKVFQGQETTFNELLECCSLVPYDIYGSSELEKNVIPYFGTNEFQSEKNLAELIMRLHLNEKLFVIEEVVPSRKEIVVSNYKGTDLGSVCLSEEALQEFRSTACKFYNNQMIFTDLVSKNLVLDKSNKIRLRVKEGLSLSNFIKHSSQRTIDIHKRINELVQNSFTKKETTVQTLKLSLDSKRLFSVRNCKAGRQTFGTEFSQPVEYEHISSEDHSLAVKSYENYKRLNFPGMLKCLGLCKVKGELYRLWEASQRLFEVGQFSPLVEQLEWMKQLVRILKLLGSKKVDVSEFSIFDLYLDTQRRIKLKLDIKGSSPPGWKAPEEFRNEEIYKIGLVMFSLRCGVTNLENYNLETITQELKKSLDKEPCLELVTSIFNPELEIHELQTLLERVILTLKSK